jgi:hypothetical protein
VINRATKPSDFFDDTAAEEAVLGRGGQKNSLKVVGKGFVGMSHLQLKFEVRDGAQSS